MDAGGAPLARVLPALPSAADGNPRTLTGRPWDSLEEFIRQGNILQIRSIMTEVVARGRRWVPARAVAPGSFIELNERDLEEIACAEHTRCTSGGSHPDDPPTGGARPSTTRGRSSPKSRTWASCR